MGFPSEDEARMAHVIAYNYAEPQHQSKIGAPRMNDNGCNFSHRPTSHCDSCRWNECQECGQNLMASFTGWTGLCIHHSHMLYKVRNIPDGSDGFYIKDDSSNGTTAPSSSTGAAAPTAAPSGASSSSASIGQSSSAASIGPSTGASQSGGTPQTKPHGGGGSSKGKNRAVMPSGGPLMASSLPQSSPGGASSATPSDAGGGSYAGGGIVIKPDPDAIVISSEDESPEAATIREIRKLYPGYPGHYELPVPGESVYKVSEILICTGSTPTKQAYTKEVHDVFRMLDNGIEKSAAYKNNPPAGFDRHTPPIKVVEILRAQNYGQEQRVLIAEQVAKARNQERPANERVPDDKIMTLFMHGTTVKNAKKIVNENIRQCRNAMHRFGKGLYGTAGIMSTAVSYAFGRYDDDPAILICDFIVGRTAKTDGDSLTDVPPKGYDSIGSGDDWVLVATEQDSLRFRYIVAIERAIDHYEFKRQLQHIEEQCIKLQEEEEAAKAKKTLSTPAVDKGAMDLSGLMASVDADEPPTMDPSDEGSSSVQLATGGPPNKKSTKPKTASAGGPSKPPTKRSAASAGGPPNKKSTKSADPGGPSTAKTSAKRNDPSSRKFVVNTNGMSASISITGGASVTVTNGNQSSTAGAGVKKPKRTYPTKTLSKNTRVKFMVGSSGGSGSSGGAGDPDGGADAGGSTQEEDEPKYKTTPEDTTEEEESDDSDDSDWA